MENLSSEIDFFERLSPIECYKLNIIACYCIILLVLSVTFNSLLLLIFFRHKKLRNSLNMLIITITFLNLIGSLSEFSFVIPSNFQCRWIFKKVGCHVSGFIMYTVGIMHIYLTMAISLERFYIIYNPFSIRKVSAKKTMIAIIVCFLLSLFWATCPLFGWSHYSLEGGLTSCSVEWAERSWNVQSYNTFMFIFTFILPLFIIIYCNTHMLIIIKKIPSTEVDHKLENEKKVSLIVMCYIAIFIFSWTPYAFVAMYSAFVDPSHISPLGATIPAMFAKSSMIWGTILYLFSNSKIRSKFNQKLFVKEHLSDVSTRRLSGINMAQFSTVNIQKLSSILSNTDAK